MSIFRTGWGTDLGSLGLLGIPNLSAKSLMVTSAHPICSAIIRVGTRSIEYDLANHSLQTARLFGFFFPLKNSFPQSHLAFDPHSAIGLNLFHGLFYYLRPHRYCSTDEMIAGLVVSPAQRISSNKAKLLPFRIFRLESQPYGVVQLQRGDN